VTSFQVRTDKEQGDAGADHLLDWFDERGASTIAYNPAFLKGLRPSSIAVDFFRLGGAVYCADKVVSREDQDDFWTRSIELQVPVSDPDVWNGAAATITKALTFLSGDRWTVSFVADTVERQKTEREAFSDTVSLFSGGLDSLSGVIDSLEDGRWPVLVAHHDSPLTATTQHKLLAALRGKYGDGRLTFRELYLRPSGPRSGQARPLPGGEVENTTRCRSFLFLSAGVAVADALGQDVTLRVPENGFIGINVPLTPARAGSLSTRTTHPLFMSFMEQVFGTVGLPHPVENPYRLWTKGEVLDRCANRKLLLGLAPASISCSHPEAPRWAKRDQGNCGYCYPCLIRRASMHRVGADDASAYAWDALSDPDLLARTSKRGRALRALASSLGRPTRGDDVLRNGRIPGGEASAFFDVYKRGRDELRAWLAGAGPALKRRLPD